MTSKMSCKNLGVLCIVAALTADFSRADVSMTKRVKEGGIISREWTSKLRIKGLKIRIDTTENGTTRVSIYDLNSGKAYQLDPKHKRVLVVDLKSASEHSKGGFLLERLRRVVKETGSKREIGGIGCDEYTFDMQAPTVTSHGVTFVEHDSGTVCVSQTVPEGIEVTNFVLEAKKRGYTTAIDALGPSPSPLGPHFFGQQPNVMVLAASSESKVDGPAMEIGAMTNVTNTFTMSDIKSDLIPDEDFQIPPDWKQKNESDFR